MAVKRSPEMVLVAYFLARYGEPGGRDGKPMPPAELDALAWKEAYALFWPVLGDGRTERTFANSLKNARDNFDSHLDLGRIGWRAGRTDTGDRRPQPLSADEERVLVQWEDRPRSDLWAAVAGFTADEPAAAQDAAWREALDDPDQREVVARRIRRGQPALRRRLLRAYGEKCAITGDGPPAVLEAAHLTSHAASGSNRSTNAVLMRADIHCLFDDGLVRIEPSALTVHVDRALRSTSYWSLNGRVLAPRADGLDPDHDALERRWQRRADTVVK